MASAILSDNPQKESEIDSLTHRVENLTHASNFWNGLMLWGLVIAAIAAVWIVWSTRLAVIRAKELGTAQGLLSDAKDRQLQIDLKSKDIEIGNLKVRSDTAEKEIGSAKADTAKAMQRAAEATKTAEDERIERLKLEAQIAPRRLTLEQMQSTASACIRFQGRSVTIRSYALDAESAILAKQLITVFQASGVQVQDATASTSPVGGFMLGIHVTGRDSTLVGEIKRILSDDGKLEVAPPGTEPKGGWEIGTGPTTPTDAEIMVGVKPLK